MNKRNGLARRWMIRFLVHWMLSILAIIAVFWLGFWYCTKMHPVWQGDELLYGPLHLLEEMAIPFFGLYSVVSGAIVGFFQFRRIGNGLWEIEKTIQKEAVDSGKIPEELAELNLKIQQYQLEVEKSRQAESEANQRKNDLIMYMAHDLKTPLTSMIGYLTLLSEEKGLPEDIRKKYQEIVLNKSLRLEDLINEFFEITRFNFTHMILEKQSVNMTRMLNQMVMEFTPIFQQKGLTCKTDFEEIEVFCDVDKMERVFDNLLKNIANYSYPNSEILLSLKKAGEKGMQLTTVNRGKTIPPEKVAHLFEQFFRVDSSRSSETGGTGLGLAVSKEIVTLHGGTITCDSGEERIIFTVTLP